jgi:hypothetical protein
MFLLINLMIRFGLKIDILKRMLGVDAQTEIIRIDGWGARWLKSEV